MTNHVHLVAIPERPDSFARGLGQTDGQYSQWFNHLVTALAYVDLNPVR